MVARTYRTPNEAGAYPGFYLRDNLNEIKEVLADSASRWQEMDDLFTIQMFSICLRKQHAGPKNPFGITPAALDNLETKHFEQYWANCERTILDTIKFLTDQKIQGPGTLPFVYLALPLCSYFHCNKAPNRDVARQWFWRNAFGLESFNNSTDVYRFCEDYFLKLEQGAEPTIAPLTLSKSRLVQASYYYRSALSRAVLAFLANQKPVDFGDPHAEVLDNVYLQLSQAPNLHHMYPQNFLKKLEGLPNDVSPDSLMNICYLRAKTNIQISDKNPLEYFQDYRGVRDFDDILESHLIPTEFLSRETFKPTDYRDFLFARAELFSRKLRNALPDVDVQIVD